MLSRCGATTPDTSTICVACQQVLPLGSDEIVTTAAPARLTDRRLTVGESFGVRYQILRLLGSGGMGEVYQAWDKELAVAVALKVIRPEIL